MGMERKGIKISNIMYGVIGVATLMLAIMGATFAYFTATRSNNTTIKGNMATIDFDLTVTKVTKVDETKGGMVPMSNNMMEAALTSSKGVCVDDNGNAVCQVYKIVLNNTSTASVFLDGYVTLTGGSGSPEDHTYTQATTGTTMRWAQAFCTTETSGVVSGCSTQGTSTTRAVTTSTGTTGITLAKLGVSDTAKADGKNLAEIKTTYASVTGNNYVNGISYPIITSNYIRVSDHLATATGYDRNTDITSALVYNQYLNANDNNSNNNNGTSSAPTSGTYTDSQVLYIVVWLSENGHNQTAGVSGAASSAISYYQGKVTFISGQGNEVTAAFAGTTKVPANTINS